MDLQDKIADYLQNPDHCTDLEWVLDTLDKYPTFYLPAALFVRRKPRGIDNEMTTLLRTSIVLNCSDRANLADFADIADAGWTDIYARDNTNQACTTDQAISTFIDTYGHDTSADDNDDELLERLIFNPVAPDYFQNTDEPYDPTDPLALPPELMPGYSVDDKDDTPAAPRQTGTIASAAHDATESPAGDDSQQPGAPAANQHNMSAPAAKPLATHPEHSNQPQEDTSLMESLAKYFIKQQRFERAYEIISKLNLNYPEKSVYFADQLRFLRKVIINRHILRQNQENK